MVRPPRVMPLAMLIVALGCLGTGYVTAKVEGGRRLLGFVMAVILLAQAVWLGYRSGE